MSETRIVSFLFRFVQPELADGDHPWHAVVRHVQSREELRFTDIDEALRFMDRYIPLLPEDGPRRHIPSSRFALVNGIRLHYLDYGGEGPPLLLLPGLTANARMFDAVAAAGLAATHRLVVLDWRGRGLSDKPDYGYSIGEHAGDVLSLMDHLGFERVVVAGHSFGGLVALHLAANFAPRISCLVLLDASHLLVSERTRALVQSTLDRLGQPVPSLEVYLEGVRRAPFLAGAWDEMLADYYRGDVEVNDDGTVQPLARAEAIAETIDMEFAEPWAEYVASIGQRALLLNALEPFGPPDAPPILPREMAMETARALHDCTYLEVPGNHITMLFGDNARSVVSAIEAFTGGSA
jgi:pimeloyl-ACP methyl ester carboxylesterase